MILPCFLAQKYCMAYKLIFLNKSDPGVIHFEDFTTLRIMRNVRNHEQVGKYGLKSSVPILGPEEKGTAL